MRIKKQKPVRQGAPCESSAPLLVTTVAAQQRDQNQSAG
jgi:hypothetical protein